MSVALYDVVIEGAGPAGCAVALELLRRRRRVLLYDRGLPGSGKVCGGFLGPELRTYVRSQGLSSAWSRLGLEPIRSVAISGPGTRELASNLPGDGGYACDRDRFDRWMLDRTLEAGADLSAGTLRTDSRRTGGLWRLQLSGPNRTIEVHTPVLVAASGRRQPARLAGRQEYFAVRTAYEGVRGLDGRVALHFVRRGHVGLNPTGSGRATMCLYVESECLRRYGADLDGLMRELRAVNPALEAALGPAARTEGWRSCRAVPDGVLRFGQDDVHYAGDAVTMVDPIIGGGIPVALEGGALLGRLLAAGGTAHQGSITRSYAREWKRRFLSRVLVAAALGRAERSDAVSGAIFGLLRWNPGVLGGLVRLTRAAP
ncbi:MAG: hypothetical protein MOGMAGMI_01659 [Candidatus Omnitrophica bacterium]|nr:hypothetical protein [Candidatus Omnitrophota bacterium]